MLPIKESAIRQVVVSIRSVQSLGKGEEKNVTEYLVLQTRIMNGKATGKWKVWGTVEESDVDTELGDKAPRALVAT